MSESENFYDSCNEHAAATGAAFGYVGGGLAAAPFAAASLAETTTPPGWLAEAATIATGAAAFDVGKELGTAVGTEAAHGACYLGYEVSSGAEHAYNALSDYLSAPAASEGSSSTHDGHSDLGASAASDYGGATSDHGGAAASAGTDGGI